MSILINENTKLVVQGMTGRDGRFHTIAMKRYGTNVVAGVSPGKGGQDLIGIPVFNTVKEAVEQTGANTSIIFVPAKYATDAICEASDAGISTVICISEGIPVLDMVKTVKYLEKNNTVLIGPNSPGLLSPGKSKVGILPGNIFKEGNVGLISRSGTLTYEIVYQLTSEGIGQSTCIGIGGDPIIGMNYIDVLKLFERDRQTEAIVLIGEIGGDAEETAAQFIKENITKPVVSYIVGQTAPPGKRMGHAGAIISSGSGTAEGKVKALEAAGVKVAKEPSEIVRLIKEVL